MKQFALLALSTLLLTACDDDMSDLHAYTDEVKANAKTSIEPMPVVEKFESFAYSASALRSPFVEPEPELVKESTFNSLDCLQPNFARNKHPLEKYPLDNLIMRGTLGADGALHGLVESTDRKIHRVRPGMYMGLYHGEVIGVSSEYIELEEMFPDGTGCWEKRETSLLMLGEDSETGQNK